MKGLCWKKELAMLILAVAVWICLLLGMRVQGMMCEGAYVLSFQQKDRFFSSADLSGIEGEGIDLTFAQHVYPKVSNGFRREEAEVFLTNENYAYIANVYMQKGAFFNEEQVRKGLSVAVFSEGAARRLFGNRECVGEMIYLNDVPYQIVGIMEEQEAEAAKVYIPYSTMECVGTPELRIGQLWCRFSNLADAAVVMKKAGFPVETLNIIQMDSVKNIFWQRFDLTLILTGAYVVFHVYKKMTGKIERMRSYGQKREKKICKKEVSVGGIHGKNVCRNEIVASMLYAVGACAGIIFIWKLAAVSWCAPPAYELLGRSRKELIYSVLDFYLLINIKIDNMRFLTHWNMLSLFFMIVYLYLFSLHCVRERGM